MLTRRHALLGGSALALPVAAKAAPWDVVLFRAPSKNLLPKWTAKLAAFDSGQAVSPRIIFLGDSTVAGQGATGNGPGSNALSQSFPTQLGNAVPTRAVNAASIFGSRNVSDITGFDARVTGSNISNSVVGWPFIKLASSGTLTFTPGVNIDTWKIWYAKAPNNGTFGVNIGGGSNLATVSTAASNAISSVTVTGSAANTALNTTNTSGADVYIWGIEASLSTQQTILMQNWGWPAALATNFADTTYPWNPPTMLSNFLPDLTFIDLTINDWNSATNQANYTASIQAIITTAQQYGDVVLMIGAPSNPGQYASQTTQATYAAIIRALGVSNNCPVVDVTALLGGSWVAANAAGLMYDGLHPNGAGYGLHVAPLLAITNLAH